MKLLDLELLVTSMRAQSGPSANPEVTFYKLRSHHSDGTVGENESHAFVEWDVDDHLFNIDAVSEFRVCTEIEITRPRIGDFNIPLKRINWYKL